MFQQLDQVDGDSGVGPDGDHQGDGEPDADRGPHARRIPLHRGHVAPATTKLAPSQPTLQFTIAFNSIRFNSVRFKQMRFKQIRFNSIRFYSIQSNSVLNPECCYYSRVAVDSIL